MAIITFTAGDLIRSSDVNNNFNEIWVTKGIQNYLSQHTAAGAHTAITGTSISISGSMSAASLSLSGAAVIGGNVTIRGNSTTISSGDLSITGNVQVTGSMTVSGSLGVTGPLSVSGISTFASMGSGTTTASSRLIAISTAQASYSTASNTYTAVPSLTVTLTTTGRPVSVGLIGDNGGNVALLSAINSTGQSVLNAEFRIRRDGTTTVAETGLVLDLDAPLDSNEISIPVQGLSSIDIVSAGTYTYTVELKASSSDIAKVSACKLVAYEL